MTDFKMAEKSVARVKKVVFLSKKDATAFSYLKHLKKSVPLQD